MNILIYGLGAIGQRYIRILQRISPESKIWAFRTTKHNQLINDDLSACYVPDLCDSLSISSLSSIREASLLEPDYIIDARPPRFHLCGIDPLLAGSKAIFCEKPLSTSAQNMRLLQSAFFDNYKDKIFVGYHFVQNPLVQLLKKKLSKVSIQRYSFIYEESLRHIQPFRTPDSMHESSANDSGSVMHSLSHAVHLALFLFSPFKTNYVSSSRHNPEYLGFDIHGCSDIYLSHSSENHSFTGFVRCAFDSHCPQQVFTIYTKELTYRLDLRQNNLEIWDGHKVIEQYYQPITKIELLTAQMTSLLVPKRLSDQHNYPLVTFDEALETLSLCDQTLY